MRECVLRTSVIKAKLCSYTAGGDTFRRFWLIDLPQALAERFGASVLTSLSIIVPTTSSQQLLEDGDDPTRDLILYQRVKPYMQKMLVYALSAVGMAFSESCARELAGRVDYGFTFTVSDIQDGQVRVKHMTVLDYAQARMLALQAYAQVQNTVGPLLQRGLSAQTGASSGSTNANGSFMTRSRKAQARAKAACRLFALSSNLFQNALEREPFNVALMQEQAFSLMGQHESTNPLLAEQALARQIRYILMQPSSMEAVAPLLIPMTSRLLLMWERRRYDQHTYALT